MSSVPRPEGRHPARVPARHPAAPAPGEVLPSHYSRCFGCGNDHSTGLHVEVTAGEGLTVSGRFTVTENHQGAPGLAHGGLLAAAFDEVLGALAWLVRVPAVTGRLETEYLRPVPVDSTLFISAAIDAMEGRKIFTTAEGRLGRPDGPLAVRASAVFVTVAIEHFKQHGRRADVDRAVRAHKAATESFEVNP